MGVLLVISNYGSGRRAAVLIIHSPPLPSHWDVGNQGDGKRRLHSTRVPTNYNRSMKPASSPALVGITSRSSQWFKRFRKAIDEHEHEVVLEGPKQIRDSIALGWTLWPLPGMAASNPNLSPLPRHNSDLKNPSSTL